MSRASDLASLLAAMGFTDSEGDEIARVWIENDTPYLALIEVKKLSMEDARKLGQWLVATTEETSA